MKLSNLKVGTRLGVGFAVLLVACLSVGGIGWYRLAQLDEVVNRITTENWEKARLTMEMEIRTRDNAFKTGRVLMAGNDTDAVKALKDEMAANTRLNSAALEQLEKLLVSPEARALLAEAADARERYVESRAQVTKLAADTKTQAEALNLFRTETAGLLEQYMTPFRKLTDLERADFEKVSRDSDATYLERAQYHRGGERGRVDRRNPARDHTGPQHHPSARKCRGRGSGRQGRPARQSDRRGRR